VPDRLTAREHDAQIVNVLALQSGRWFVERANQGLNFSVGRRYRSATRAKG
jgi:hypothetical protein